ncbi:MAG: hypothetical protein M3Q57_08050 [Pseudomonadota bacterium]|nr:hypothetical protein [Pseudomonadota bacterium]
MVNNVIKSLTGAALGVALCVSSTAASAAALPQSSISPLVALSAFGTQSSSSAVCAAGVGSAGAVAAAGQALVVPATQGCVLPMIDQPVVPVVQNVPPPVYVPPAVVASQGLGFLPLIAGLALVAGLAALLLSNDDDDDGLVIGPVSP